MSVATGISLERQPPDNRLAHPGYACCYNYKQGRQIMARVPAYCPNCGAIFPAPIELGAGASIVLQNCVTNCPFCGGTAQLDGEFQGAEDAIRVIRSRFITREALKAFAVVLRDAYEKHTSIEETKKRAAAIDPALGEAIDKISASRNVWAASLLVLMFALSHCNFDVKVSLDMNEFLRDMRNRSPASIMQSIPLPKPDPRPNKSRT